MFKFFTKFSSPFLKKYFQLEIFLKGWETPLKSSSQQHTVNTKGKGLFFLISAQHPPEGTGSVFKAYFQLLWSFACVLLHQQRTERKQKKSSRLQ